MPALRYHPDRPAATSGDGPAWLCSARTGLGFAATAAGVIALLGQIGSGGASAALIRAVSILDAAIGSISLITVLDTAVLWRILAGAGPTLDAQTAEILGEVKAHTAHRRAGPTNALLPVTPVQSGALCESV
jgi:hypothetical protein